MNNNSTSTSTNIPSTTATNKYSRGRTPTSSLEFFSRRGFVPNASSEGISLGVSRSHRNVLGRRINPGNLRTKPRQRLLAQNRDMRHSPVDKRIPTIDMTFAVISSRNATG